MLIGHLSQLHYPLILAKVKRLHGDLVPLTLWPRIGDFNQQEEMAKERGGEDEGPAVARGSAPGLGCESQGPTKRRCQLTLGRGRRPAKRPNPVLSNFHLLLPSQHNLTPAFAGGEGAALSSSRLAHPAPFTVGGRGDVPQHPGTWQRGVGPASHGAWLGASPGAGSGLPLLLLSHVRAKGSGRQSYKRDSAP